MMLNSRGRQLSLHDVKHHFLDMCTGGIVSNSIPEKENLERGEGYSC